MAGSDQVNRSADGNPASPFKVERLDNPSTVVVTVSSTDVVATEPRVMAGRLRRRASFTEPDHDDGPFVSFTDLFIGILFLFLILVATLMLMQQDAVQKQKSEAQVYAEQVQQIQAKLDAAAKLRTEARAYARQVQGMQAKLDAAAKLDAEHPSFRLAIVYNAYQRPIGARTGWTYSRTVQVYRAGNDLCLNNVILRNNLSLSWKTPVSIENIPTAANQAFVRMGAPCTLSASEEQWNMDSETGGVRRVSENIYVGTTVLHKKTGNEPLEILYEVLGIYDDHFRWNQASGASRGPP